MSVPKQTLTTKVSDKVHMNHFASVIQLYTGVSSDVKHSLLMRRFGKQNLLSTGPLFTRGHHSG